MASKVRVSRVAWSSRMEGVSGRAGVGRVGGGGAGELLMTGPLTWKYPTHREQGIRSLSRHPKRKLRIPM